MKEEKKNEEIKNAYTLKTPMEVQLEQEARQRKSKNERRGKSKMPLSTNVKVT